MTKVRTLTRILGVLFPVLQAGVLRLVEAMDAGSDGGRKVTRAEWSGIADAMFDELVEHGLAEVG